jgi:hypothetical protein
MCPTDLPAIDDAEAVGAKMLHAHNANLAPSWRELLQPRLLSGAAWVAFVLFTYVLVSFHNLLQPAFTTTEAVLALVVLGFAVSRV